MPVKSALFWWLLGWLPASLAAAPDAAANQAVHGVSPGDVAAWALGLALVLAVFFLCVWCVRKLGGLNVGGAGQMRLIGGLSLGVREKVVLLQVGKKQLVLAVTPGRIEALLVLEGDSCLQRGERLSAHEAEAGFTEKFAQMVKSGTDA